MDIVDLEVDSDRLTFVVRSGIESQVVDLAEEYDNLIGLWSHEPSNFMKSRRRAQKYASKASSANSNRTTR